MWWLILTHLVAAALGAFLMSLLTMAKFSDLEEDNDQLLRQIELLARQYKDLLVRREGQGKGADGQC